MIKLKPLIEAPPNGKFAVCDIEAANWIDFLILGYFDGQKFLEFYSLKKFLQYIFTIRRDSRPDSIFAHFGGKYDFLFFINELIEMPGFEITNCIPRGSSLLCFDLEHKGIKITFRDSAAFFPFSLDRVTKTFGVKHKKKKFNFKTLTKVTPELIKYLEYDCRGLFESIVKYIQNPLIMRAGFKFTTASQSMAIFRTFMDTPIDGIYGAADDFIRKSYFGGRTEIFKPIFDNGYREDEEGNFLGFDKLAVNFGEKINCYDINSLYPSVMADQNNDFPGGIAGITDKLNFNDLGFFWCKVFVPEQYMPPLPYLYKGKLLFPCGYLEGIWSVAELKNAVKHYGVKIIKVKSGYKCHNIGNPFSDFINKLYFDRLEAKKRGDSVTDIVCKLAMNAFYGRMGLRSDRENVAFDSNQADFNHKWDILRNNKEIRLGTIPVELTTSFKNIAIAAYTTSYARIKNLNTASKIAEKHLYYTDTDSFLINSKLKENKELGGLKLEYSAAQACFLLPKTYCVKTSKKDFEITLEDDDPDFPTKSNKKVVMKGFNSRKIWHNFDINHFKTALEGDLKGLKIENEPKFATFKRALQKNKILTMLDAESRQINSTYSKRIIYKNKGGNYDTRPLLITTTGDIK